MKNWTLFRPETVKASLSTLNVCSGDCFWQWGSIRGGGLKLLKTQWDPHLSPQTKQSASSVPVATLEPLPNESPCYVFCLLLLIALLWFSRWLQRWLSFIWSVSTCICWWVCTFRATHTAFKAFTFFKCQPQRQTRNKKICKYEREGLITSSWHKVVCLRFNFLQLTSCFLFLAIVLFFQFSLLLTLSILFFKLS